MAERLILLPMKDPETPDMLGSKLEVVAIKTNYRDCAKVLVSGSAKDLADLAAKSKEHFEQAWPRPA